MVKIKVKEFSSINGHKYLRSEAVINMHLSDWLNLQKEANARPHADEIEGYAYFDGNAVQTGTSYERLIK